MRLAPITSPPRSRKPCAPLPRADVPALRLPGPDGHGRHRRRLRWPNSVLLSAVVHGVAGLLLLTAWAREPATSCGGQLQLHVVLEELTETDTADEVTPERLEATPLEVAHRPPEVIFLPERPLEDTELEDLEPLQTREPVCPVEIPLSVLACRVDRPEPAPEPPPPTARPATPPPPSVPSVARRRARLQSGPLQPLSMPTWYPPEALQRGVAGTVLIEVAISMQGEVYQARIVATSGWEVLDQAAVASALRWRFAPIPARRRALIPIQYVIGGAVRTG